MEHVVRLQQTNKTLASKEKPTIVDELAQPPQQNTHAAVDVDCLGCEGGHVKRLIPHP